MAKKKKTEEKIVEKEFVVPLSRVFRAPKKKRAYRAINCIKKFIFKHLRVKAENTAISQALNHEIWAKGREHIPRRVEIKVLKDGEKARVFLKGEKIEKPKKEEKKGKEKEEKKTAGEKAEEEEIKKKKEEKKAKEKAAEAAAIKRGTNKEGK